MVAIITDWKCWANLPVAVDENTETTNYATQYIEGGIGAIIQSVIGVLFNQRVAQTRENQVSVILDEQ